MSYSEYSPTTWRNQQSPKINATNLNKLETGVHDNSQHIIELDENKVSKETGKGLSTNDFTDTDKAKLNAVVAPTNAYLGQGYAECSTPYGTSPKVVALTDYDASRGGIVAIKFTEAVEASASMKINDASNFHIYYDGTFITDGLIKAGDTAFFMLGSIPPYGMTYRLLGIARAVETIPEKTYTYKHTLPTGSGSSSIWRYDLPNHETFTPEQLASLKAYFYTDDGNGGIADSTYMRFASTIYFYKVQAGDNRNIQAWVTFPQSVSAGMTLVMEGNVESEGTWNLAM